jgi:hypothetical protein
MRRSDRGRAWRGGLALLVVSAALLVFVPASSASLPVGGSGTVSAVDGTGTEINIPVQPMFGASGGTFLSSGSIGSRSNSFVPGTGPVPDLFPTFTSIFTNFDLSCNPEEPLPYWTLTDALNGLPVDDCWSLALGTFEAPPLGGTWGWKVPQTAIGSDGTTPVVFDHWNVTNASPMQPVFADQTTAGTPGYCTSGERGIQGIFQSGFDLKAPWDSASYPGGYVAYQSYVNTLTGVGTDTSYQAVYAPADPDVSPPQITFSLYLDCQTFDQNSTTGSKDGTVGGTYDFSCTDPGYGTVTGPTGVKSCTATVNGTPVNNGDTIDTSTAGDYTLTVTAVDNGNNESQRSVTYHVLDDVPPTLNPSFSATPPFTENQVVTINPGAADTGSGLKSSGCDPVNTSTVGNHTITCTATDNAGNTNSQQITYFVGYGTDGGFRSPTKNSKWKRGQTVPIKVQLTTASGAPISSTEAAALSKNCKVTVSASGVQTITAPGCMKYDTTSKQFVYNWQLRKTSATGGEQLTITIGYPSGGPTTLGPLPITIS